MNILQLAEIETLRNSARKAIADGLADAEFYYSRADKATTEEERKKADAAGARREENAQWVSAYITKLESSLKELQEQIPRIASEARQQGYEAANSQMIKATQAKSKDAEISGIRAYNDKKFGHSTEGQWRNGHYVGSDKFYRKTQQ
jgi:hypothetical protein